MFSNISICIQIKGAKIYIRIHLKLKPNHQTKVEVIITTAVMRKEKMNNHKVRMKVMNKVFQTKAKCLNIKNAILIASSKQK